MGSQERTKEPPRRNPAMSIYRFRALKVSPGRKHHGIVTKNSNPMMGAWRDCPHPASRGQCPATGAFIGRDPRSPSCDRGQFAATARAARGGPTARCASAYTFHGPHPARIGTCRSSCSRSSVDKVTHLAPAGRASPLANCASKLRLKLAAASAPSITIRSLSCRLRPDAEKFAAPVRSNLPSIW